MPKSTLAVKQGRGTAVQARGLCLCVHSNLVDMGDFQMWTNFVNRVLIELFKNVKKSPKLKLLTRMAVKIKVFVKLP